MIAQQATEPAVKPIPEGYHSVTLYLQVEHAADLIEFVKLAFGAEERFRGTGSAGGIHCEVRIGDSMLMIGGGGVWKGTPRPAAIHLYVEDADAIYQRALDAGATTMHAPIDQPYGDREAGVKDPFGNCWYIATHTAKEDAGPLPYIPQGLCNVTPYFHSDRARKHIEFLKQAFWAEEVFCAQDPNGTVHHAKIGIGDSIVEMSDARDQYQPMNSAIYLYVADADAVYTRALQAGATSLYASADQPYGDRNGGVADPFGNHWYISTHIRDMAGAERKTP